MEESLSLTKEQQEILLTVKHMCVNEILKINAFAGTGKTSTLIAISRALPQKQFLYLAFNSAIVEECRKKFPFNVTIKTTHSLAFAHIALPQLIHAHTLHDGNYRPAEIAELYGVQHLVAYEALSVLEAFFTSTAPRIQTQQSQAHELASRIYSDMVEGRRKMTHSFYLKQYQLLEDKSFVKYDYILLDEGQDTNDVSLDIFLSFEAAKIIVGDTHQAIYGWRGAMNAMDKVEADFNHYLTTTFRCTQPIVDKANYVLKTFKGEKIKIISHCLREPQEERYAIITRTNAKIIENLAEYEDEYRLVKKPETIFDMAIAMHYWLNGEAEKILNPSLMYLKNFKHKASLEAYIEETHAIELQACMSIAKRYKKALFPLFKKAKAAYSKGTHANKPPKKEDTRMFLLSAHSSKGLEFDTVELENDFPCLKDTYAKSDRPTAELFEEANIYYVALTRTHARLNDKSKNNALFLQKLDV